MKILIFNDNIRVISVVETYVLNLFKILKKEHNVILCSFGKRNWKKGSLISFKDNKTRFKAKLLKFTSNYNLYSKLKKRILENSAKFFNQKLDPQRISSEIQSFLYEEKLE